MFSNHFITNCPQNAPLKILRIGQYLAKIWTKLCGLLFGPPCTLVAWTKNYFDSVTIFLDNETNKYNLQLLFKCFGLE